MLNRWFEVTQTFLLKGFDLKTLTSCSIQIGIQFEFES